MRTKSLSLLASLLLAIVPASLHAQQGTTSATAQMRVMVHIMPAVQAGSLAPRSSAMPAMPLPSLPVSQVATEETTTTYQSLWARELKGSDCNRDRQRTSRPCSGVVVTRVIAPR